MISLNRNYWVCNWFNSSLVHTSYSIPHTLKSYVHCIVITTHTFSWFTHNLQHIPPLILKFVACSVFYEIINFESVLKILRVFYFVSEFINNLSLCCTFLTVCMVIFLVITFTICFRFCHFRKSNYKSFKTLTSDTYRCWSLSQVLWHQSQHWPRDNFLMRPANKRWRCTVTSSFIGWAHSQKLSLLITTHTYTNCPMVHHTGCATHTLHMTWHNNQHDFYQVGGVSRLHCRQI